MRLSEAFAVLGVPNKADLKEIKSAYRKRVIETHPDKGGNSAEFIKVRAAYEILCSFLQSPDIDDDVPISDDLRSVIDEIVLEFRSQFERSEALCAQVFSEFNTTLQGRIASAGRDQLQGFSEVFRTQWNKLVCDLFEHFNANCRATIHKYEGWFQKTLEPTFEEIHKRKLRAFSTSPRFYFYGVLLLGLGSLFAAIAYGSGVSDSIADYTVSYLVPSGLLPYLSGLDSIHVSILLGSLMLVILPFIYQHDCDARRKYPADVQTLSVQLFKIDPGREFEGSVLLQQSSTFTKVAGFGGFNIGGLVSGGIGGSILGAMAGAVIGEVVGRIKNPTGKMRQMILDEFNRFVSIAEPEVTKYVRDSHQKLMQHIQKEILANYEQGIKKTVLLFAADSPPVDKSTSRQADSANPRAQTKPSNRELLIEASKYALIATGVMLLFFLAAACLMHGQIPVFGGG